MDTFRVTDRGTTEETFLLAWRPLSQAHELIWKIGLMVEVGQSDPYVAFSQAQTPCQHPVGGMRALPSASYSESTINFLVLLYTRNK